MFKSVLITSSQYTSQVLLFLAPCPNWSAPCLQCDFLGPPSGFEQEIITLIFWFTGRLNCAENKIYIECWKKIKYTNNEVKEK